ncbi:MAG: hypothetical protein MZV65_49975 [Chromatiales bacterium]|nr:hypothetical protein [Chromatiales bacterium]
MLASGRLDLGAGTGRDRAALSLGDRHHPGLDHADAGRQRHRASFGTAAADWTGVCSPTG